MFACQNHPEADAGWMCAGCARVFCDECLVRRQKGRATFELCKDCGGLCHAVEAGITVDEAEVARSFAAAVIYPLQGFGPVIVLGGGLFAACVWMVGGLLGALISYGLILGYAIDEVRTTAHGRDTAPDWPDPGDIFDLLQPTALAAATALLSFYPARYAFEQGHPALAYVLTIAGIGYAPMAWIAASLSRRVLAITPITVLPLIAKVNSTYWLACIALVPLVGLHQYGMAWLAAKFSFAVGTAIATTLGFYLLMVEMRVLGLVWRHNRDELGLG